MNLETVISVVAGYFYSIFTSLIDNSEKKGIPIDWEQITKTRYLDWSITTPIMLLSLCIVLTYNVNKKISLSTMLLIIILNYTMLLIGYLGEIHYINHNIGLIGGFIPFFAMFYVIYTRFVKPYKNSVNSFLLGLYIFFWGFYGVVYNFPLEYKNIIMNILDCLAKCLVGLGFWVYYANFLVWNK
jgi:bacteriorhodopsin